MVDLCRKSEPQGPGGFSINGVTISACDASKGVKGSTS